MPCNAIATARAQVAQENLAKFLTDELVGPLVMNYLKRKYSNLVPRQEVAWDGVDFVMDSYRVHIRGGVVNVTAGWSGDQATCDALAAEITGLLTKAAGLLFQRQVRQAVASRYAISEEQRAPNGALVLSVEL